MISRCPAGWGAFSFVHFSVEQSCSFRSSFQTRDRRRAKKERERERYLPEVGVFLQEYNFPIFRRTFEKIMFQFFDFQTLIMINLIISMKF